MPKCTSVEEYLAAMPDEVREVLLEIRRRVLLAVPDAGERISYDMPGMTQGGKVFVNFAGWKKHVSLYPVPDTAGDEELTVALAPYAGAKGTLKFPLSAPVPFDLVEKVAALLAVQRGGAQTPV